MFNVQVETNNTISLANNILKEIDSCYNEPIIKKIKYTKARSYWARIEDHGNNEYVLFISNVFDSIPDEVVARKRFTSTMIHELIHTMDGCMNHGRKFQRMCYLVNRKYPQYKLQSSTAAEDVGLVTQMPVAKYVITCKHCKHEYNYSRKPRYSLDKYTCGYCSHSEFELKTL